MKVLVAVTNDDVLAEVVAFVSHHRWPAGSQFRLVHVVEPVLLDANDCISFNSLLDDTRAEIMQERTELLNATASKLIGVAPSSQVSAMVVEGHVADEIVKAAEDWVADLIVIGSRSRSQLNKLLLGSVCRDVLGHCKCSCAVVRQASAAHGGAGKRIVIAVDESSYAKDLVEFVAKHRWDRSDCFKLVHVLKPLQVSARTGFFPAAVLTDLNVARRQKAHELLDDLSSELFASVPGNRIDCEILEGFPADEIIRQAKEWHADIIFMGSHGRGGIKRFLLGSVAASVSNSALAATIIVRRQNVEASGDGEGETKAATSEPIGQASS